MDLLNKLKDKFNTITKKEDKPIMSYEDFLDIPLEPVDKNDNSDTLSIASTSAISIHSNFSITSSVVNETTNELCLLEEEKIRITTEISKLNFERSVLNKKIKYLKQKNKNEKRKELFLKELQTLEEELEL